MKYLHKVKHPYCSCYLIVLENIGQNIQVQITVPYNCFSAKNKIYQKKRKEKKNGINERILNTIFYYNICYIYIYRYYVDESFHK